MEKIEEVERSKREWFEKQERKKGFELGFLDSESVRKWEKFLSLKNRTSK